MNQEPSSLCRELGMPRDDRYRPLLSNACIDLMHEVTATDERERTSTLAIPAERPLTVYLDKRELVTLMTLGGAPEALTLGYLRNQRFIESIEEIASIQVDWDVDAAAVTTRPGVKERMEERLSRRTDASNAEARAQGAADSVFGGLMDEIDAIVIPADARLKQSTLYRIVDTIRTQKSIYKQAGSLHACALFTTGGELLYFIEDVGRHNAVDAIAGKMMLDDVRGHDKVFYTTGRLTSEMVIKGGQMGIPFLLSRSGTTQMGHAVAQRLGITMFARCSGQHFLLLSGRERLILEPEIAPLV
jgi:FdhD protein